MPNVQVNATISARDAASKKIKTINNALGTLGKTASTIGSDFKKVGLGIIGLAAGASAFAIAAVKDAAKDQASAQQLLSTLKTRKLATDSVTAAIERQIEKSRLLAFTGEEVRSSVEISTRFTKKYAEAQKIQNVAMDLARATGMSLSDATLALGKAYQGSGAKLFATLGITNKHLTGMKAINAIYGKTKGSAAAYADTVEGSFAVLKDSTLDLRKQIGFALLPSFTKLFKGLTPYIERLSHLITANTPKLQRWADIIVTKILDKLPSLFAEFEANVPRALIGIEQFIDKITGVGKEADKLLGPGGSITLLVSGIGAAFGGLKGVITANLVKNGMDPFTALIVANIAAQVPASLASALTSAIVSKAVAAFGTSVATASAGGAAASAAAGVGGTAATGGLSALLGAATLPVTIVALSVAATAALTSAITDAGMTNKVGGNGVIDIFGTTAATTAGTPPKDIFKDLGDLWTFITTGKQPATAPTGSGGNLGTTYNNIYLGTTKIDTVVTDSLKRTGNYGRGR